MICYVPVNKIIIVRFSDLYISGFLGTFTWLGFKDLLWAAALVLHDLNDHSSGASLSTSGLKASPLQAGQLARTPR